MDAVQRMVNRLEAGADTFACGDYLASLDPLHRYEIYNPLVFERLKRKYDDVQALYYDIGQNWNLTFYMLIFRFLGAPSNREAFEKLSNIASYAVAIRFMSSKLSPVDKRKQLEALFIGSSGLLNLYYDDEYTTELKKEFYFISQKYRIEPMSTSEWKLSGLYPHNHPVLRMAQMAAFFSRGDFSIDRILTCRKPKDVASLFDADVSKYWLEHFIPSAKSAATTKRIGTAKSDILAINVVVMLLYAYGTYIMKYELCDQALGLLEAVDAENNFKVRRWTANGVRCKSAFETQALIQLGDEYCLKKRCRECPIGKRLIKSVERSCNIE